MSTSTNHPIARSADDSHPANNDPVNDDPTSPMSNFGSYLTIKNRSKASNLQLISKETISGEWDKGKEPPNVILPGGSILVVLRDKIGTFGSEGRITYAYDRHVHLHFGCPTLSDNFAEHSGAYPVEKDYNSTGSPMYATYEIGPEA